MHTQNYTCDEIMLYPFFWRPIIIVQSETSHADWLIAHIVIYIYNLLLRI